LGETLSLSGVKVSLHPAGHVLGSAQVRIEWRGEVWVVSGDYKTDPDPTCKPFEPVRCHTFITEATFGLPVYRWPPPTEVFRDINDWWRENAAAGKPSLLFAYALGKAQRLLAGIDPTIGPVFTHGAVQVVNERYRAAGVRLPDTRHAREATSSGALAGALVVAPPSAQGSPWVRKFGNYASAFASGWMLIRGTRRRRAVDRGFVVSDHADWCGLGRAIEATGAQRVLVTHGATSAMARWLCEQGYDAAPLETRFAGELDDATDDESGVNSR
jgi:putative mRNA 3-end processing factor